jgi:hypothetical protein
MRAGKDGSAAAPIATQQNVPFAIFVDDESIYWTTFVPSGSVVRLPKAGGAPIELATGQDHPNAVVATDAYVYWTNAGASAASGSVSRVAKTGGATLVLGALTAPSDLAVDATDVYWASQGSVFRVPK